MATDAVRKPGAQREASFLYATESMRLTTRLMQLASWLLLQRAVNEGEITRKMPAPKRRRSSFPPRRRNVAGRAMSNCRETCAIYIDKGDRLFDRVMQFDTLERGKLPERTGVAPLPITFPPMAVPSRFQLARLKATLGSLGIAAHLTRISTRPSYYAAPKKTIAPPAERRRWRPQTYPSDPAGMRFHADHEGDAPRPGDIDATIGARRPALSIPVRARMKAKSPRCHQRRQPQPGLCLPHGQPDEVAAANLERRSCKEQGKGMSFPRKQKARHNGRAFRKTASRLRCRGP
jgi:hypothetical protein